MHSCSMLPVIRDFMKAAFWPKLKTVSRNPFRRGRFAQKNGCLHAVALDFCQLHETALQLHSAIPVQPRWRRRRDCCGCCGILNFTRNLVAICQIGNVFARKCYFPVY